MPTTIEAIEPIPFRLPLREPLRWGTASEMQEARHVLIKVRLSDGAVGWGEAPPRPTIYGETVSSICSVVCQELAPRLEGEMLDDSTLAKLYASLQVVKNNQAAAAPSIWPSTMPLPKAATVLSTTTWAPATPGCA